MVARATVCELNYVRNAASGIVFADDELRASIFSSLVSAFVDKEAIICIALTKCVYGPILSECVTVADLLKPSIAIESCARNYKRQIHTGQDLYFKRLASGDWLIQNPEVRWREAGTKRCNERWRAIVFAFVDDWQSTPDANAVLLSLHPFGVTLDGSGIVADRNDAWQVPYLKFGSEGTL